MRIRDIERAIHAVERAQNKLIEFDKKYPIKYKKELERVAERTITQWYNSYLTPIVYDRAESLYHAYKIEIIGTDIHIDFDSSYMDEYVGRDVNSLIYENSFVSGYHGGASSGTTKNGQSHPHPGIPYWKTPIPKFTNWGRPALRSFSPYYRIKNLMDQKIKEIDKEKDREWQKEIDNIKRCISKLI